MRRDYYLWQIYHIEEDVARAKAEAAAQRAELAAAEAAAAAAEGEVEAARRETAGLAKERLLLEKKVKKKQGEAEKKVSGEAGAEGGDGGGALRPAAAAPPPPLLFESALGCCCSAPSSLLGEPASGALSLCVPCSAPALPPAAAPAAAPSRPPASLSPLQNPALLKVREEISRLGRRVKAGEKETGELRRKRDEQAAGLARLQEQLEALEDGGLGGPGGGRAFHGAAGHFMHFMGLLRAEPGAFVPLWERVNADWTTPFTCPLPPPCRPCPLPLLQPSASWRRRLPPRARGPASWP